MVKKAKVIVKKQRPLTIKQRKFVDEVVKTGNATEAVKKAGYKHKNTHVEESVGSENLRKPEIKHAIEDRLKVAKDIIYGIAIKEEEKSDTRLRACQDIIDRVEGKPTQKVEQKVDGELTIKLVNYGDGEKNK